MLSGTETAYFVTLSSFLVSAGIAEGMGLVVHFLTSGPVLVGEIIAGMVCGPMILDAFPTMADHMRGVGQVAMMVLLFERGLHTNFASIAQCGAIGFLMAVLSIALSMLLVAVALSVNGQPLIESIIGGCIMSTTVFGLVDVGWRRLQVKEMSPLGTLTGDLIDAATSINTMLIMSVLSVLYNISPSSKAYHPVDQWWVVCQPMLFSLAFILSAVLLRVSFNVFCLKGSDRYGGGGVFCLSAAKADPNSELYNLLDFLQVSPPLSPRYLLFLSPHLSYCAACFSTHLSSPTVGLHDSVRPGHGCRSRSSQSTPPCGLYPGWHVFWWLGILPKFLES